jgi:hypothetical protein
LGSGIAQRSRNGQFIAPPTQARTGGDLSQALACSFYPAMAAVHQNAQKLILGPASEEVTRAKTVTHGLSDNLQHGIARALAVSGTEAVQVLYLDMQDSKRKMVGLKAGQTLAQMKLREAAIGNSRSFIQAAVARKVALITIPLELKFLNVKALSNSNHRTVTVAHSNGSHYNHKRMSVAMAQAQPTFAWFSIAQGNGERTTGAAILTTLMIAVHQNVIARKMPENLMTDKSRDPLGALVPKQNFPIPVCH